MHIKRCYVWIVICFAVFLCVMLYIIGKNVEFDTRATEFDETKDTVYNTYSTKQNENVTTNDNSPSTNNHKKDPYQGEWDPQSN